MIMKKTFTLASIVISSLAVAQQTFRMENFDDNKSPILPNSAIYGNAPASKTHSVNLDIINTTSVQQTYGVKRYDIQLHATSTETAEAFFCFYGLCYPPFVMESPDPVPLQGFEKTSDLEGDYWMLVPEIKHFSTSGLNVIKYTVFNTAMPSDSMQFSMRYNDPNAGLNSHVSPKMLLSVAPNPAHGHASALVSLPVAGRCAIAIYDILGARVGS